MGDGEAAALAFMTAVKCEKSGAFFTLDTERSRRDDEQKEKK